MSLVLLFALAATEAIAPVRIAPGKWRNLPIQVEAVPLRVQASFKVLDGSPPVRALLLRRDEAENFWHNRNYRAEEATSYEKDGFLGCWLTEPGAYELVIDNMFEAHASATVELNIGYVNGTPPTNSRTLPPPTRKLVVTLSLLLFACIAAPASYALRRAFGRHITNDALPFLS